VFILIDRGTGDRYVVPAKAADESVIRLLLTDRQQESLMVYTDGFRAYEPLDVDDAFDREYVVHGDIEYADGDVYVNTCESQDRAPSRRLQRQAHAVSQSVSIPSCLSKTGERSAQNHP